MSRCRVVTLARCRRSQEAALSYCPVVRHLARTDFSLTAVPLPILLLTHTRRIASTPHPPELAPPDSAGRGSGDKALADGGEGSWRGDRPAGDPCVYPHCKGWQEGASGQPADGSSRRPMWTLDNERAPMPRASNGAAALSPRLCLAFASLARIRRAPARGSRKTCPLSDPPAAPSLSAPEVGGLPRNSATAQRPDGLTGQRRDGATAERRDGATAQRRGGATMGPVPEAPGGLG
jgi:hypothetical protein